MVRRWSCIAVCIVFAFTCSASAAEKKGKFVKYDKESKALTIRNDEGETTFTLAEDTRVITAKGEPTKFTIGSFGDPKIAKIGALLAVVFDEKDGKIVKVTEIKLGGREKK